MARERDIWLARVTANTEQASMQFINLRLLPRGGREVAWQLWRSRQRDVLVLKHTQRVIPDALIRGLLKVWLDIRWIKVDESV